MASSPTGALPTFEDADKQLKIKLTFRDQELQVDNIDQDTIASLAEHLAEATGIDVKRLTLWIKPKPGIQKYPFAETLLADVLKPNSSIKVIGTSDIEVESLQKNISQMRARTRARGAAPKAAPSKHRDWKKVQEESTYTFHTIRPLPYLPNPEKSQRYLERLAADPGIKASMRKHKFSVGLLTEMNPAEHTTHESKTLGLNRNAGEVIELRLRTDRYDGYRDYKVIRKTLCHELSHNVWGEHDSNFWALTREIEKEVDANDWKHGGHKLTNNEFYDPNDTYDENEHADHGAWTGGEYVLGSTSTSENEGLSRREIMARAAQSRLDKERAAKEQEEP
jgi:WLM domain